MVPHQGLVNYLYWCSSAYQLSEGSGTLVDTPIGFDLTVTSMLAPLLVGQAAVLVPEDKGIESLAEALRTAIDVTLIKKQHPHTWKYCETCFLMLVRQTHRAVS